jgi:hypothetical protein
MRRDIVPRDILPSDLSQQVNRMLQQNRSVEACQERDYRVDYANGDRMYIHERTVVRICEVNK